MPSDRVTGITIIEGVAMNESCDFGERERERISIIMWCGEDRVATVQDMCRTEVSNTSSSVLIFIFLVAGSNAELCKLVRHKYAIMYNKVQLIYMLHCSEIWNRIVTGSYVQHNSFNFNSRKRVMYDVVE